MDETNLQKIKKFNEEQSKKREEKEKIPTHDTEEKETPTSVTDREKVKQKAEQKQKTQKEIDDETKALKEQQDQEQIDTLKQVTNATSVLIDTVNKRVEPAKNWVSSLPTPGGIAAILIFVFFFALVAIPVNDQGQTRLYLFWQTLMGRTHLKYRENTTVSKSTTSGTTDLPLVGGSASGTFGSGGPNTNNGSSTPVDVTHLDLFGFF